MCHVCTCFLLLAHSFVRPSKAGVEMFKKLLNEGQAGDNVGLLLRGIKRDDVERGQVGTVGNFTAVLVLVVVVRVDEGVGTWEAAAARHQCAHNALPCRWCASPAASSRTATSRARCAHPPVCCAPKE